MRILRSIKKFWRYLHTTGVYRIINFISKSATIGLLITLVIFVIEWRRSDLQDEESRENFNATLTELNQIQQSLSTRFLGIFPGYITDICSLFLNIEPGDSVTVFEDVLYYGIKSRPHEFQRYNMQLIKHALSGGHVLVAYYDHKLDSTAGKPVWENVFHKMIMESRISADHINEMVLERRTMPRKPGTARNWSQRFATDSILCEKYFKKSKAANKEKYRKDINAYLDSSLIAGFSHSSGQMPDSAALVVERMCREIDSVKHACLDKGVEKVTFADYERMYRGMSDVIAHTYERCGIELLPLNDYLTMSCWLVKPSHQDYQRSTEAILAFPSKYSSDEIGFYSQDEAFSTYIMTMQKGIKDEQGKTGTMNKE